MVLGNNHEMAVPLEQKKLPMVLNCKGNVEEVHALDASLCEDGNFPLYTKPPDVSIEENPLLWQEFYQRLTNMREKLTWLLKLPYHKFWCQAINDPSLQHSLESYIRFAPRYAETFTEYVANVHMEVHRLVFLTFIRMSTHHEGDSKYFTPSAFGELLYQFYLFDIAKLMDICALYCNEVNIKLLSKAIGNIFQQKEEYKQDFKSSLKTILEIVHNIEQKCGMSSLDGSVPARLSETNNILHDMRLRQFHDVILYASDTFHTINSFLTVYQDGCHDFLESDVFSHLPSFYCHTLGAISNALATRNIEDLHMKSTLLNHIAIAKYRLLGIVQLVTKVCFVDRIIEHETTPLDLIDQYLSLLSKFVEEAEFCKDLTSMFGLLDDLKQIIEICPDVQEDARVSFLFGSMSGAKKSVGVVNNAHNQSTSISEQVTTNHIKETAGPSSSQAKSTTDIGATSDNTSHLVASVKDMLPELSNDFIKVCLSCYDNSVERTLNALLEDSLPESITSLDRTKSLPEEVMAKFLHLEIHEEQPVQATTPDEDVLPERKNIFDNDEFDVFNRDNIDTSRVYQAKKDRTDEDAFDISDIREKYAQYSVITSDDEGHLYDDEYDDTYDGIGINANDADDADDLLSRRPFITPRLFLMDGKRNKDEQQSESEEEQEQKNLDHFIANPADVRARNEARRRQAQERRQATKKAPKPRAKHTETIAASSIRSQEKTAEVSGTRPKQNRDKSPKPKEQKDRKFKDANKSRFGNHNRKNLATRKHAKGM